MHEHEHDVPLRNFTMMITRATLHFKISSLHYIISTPGWGFFNSTQYPFGTLCRVPFFSSCLSQLPLYYCLFWISYAYSILFQSRSSFRLRQISGHRRQITCIGGCSESIIFLMIVLWPAWMGAVTVESFLLVCPRLRRYLTPLSMR